MSAHSRNEYEQLLMAHGNRELEPEAVAQLEALASGDPERERELGELRQLHGWLDGERALRAAAMAPPEPGEAGSELFQRLARRAARAEQALRTMAVEESSEAVLSRRRVLTMPRVAVALAAAVLVLGVGAALGMFTPSTPPENIVLNKLMPIVLDPELTADSRTISWHAVVGVAHYDCVIEDGDHRLVVERAEQHARSTVWELTEDEFARLKAHGEPLYLRVTGFDGVGFQLASTGDLELSVR